MVRYVKRPRSAIERHAFKDAHSRRHSVVDQKIEPKAENRASILSSWAHLPPPPEGATENEIKRRLIVQSLVKTEKSYITSLETVEHDYRRRY